MPQRARAGVLAWTAGSAWLLLAGTGPVEVRADPASSRPADVAPDRPTPVVSRELELHYHIADAGADARVELWYTRDRGATWHSAGIDDDATSPFLFRAPADGLYGVILSVRHAQAASHAPERFQSPHRWLLIDSTPPLLQWDGVDRSYEVGRCMFYLRWTAFDEHFPSRPISLSYKTAETSQWHLIASELGNLGRYEWAVPPDCTGAVWLRLAARDAAGSMVERMYGPVQVGSTDAPAEAAAGPASRPVEAPAPTTRPAHTAPASSAAREKAETLYRQGSWHLVRGQYALAAQRFLEAIEADTDHLAARNDLAGIYYLQRDYPRALELYQSVLARDSRHTAALRGAALACVAQKQYAQSRQALERLLAIDGKDAEAWLDLGDVLFMMGSQNEARSHWSKAARIDPAAEAIIQKARRRLELYAPGQENSGTAAGRGEWK